MVRNVVSKLRGYLMREVTSLALKFEIGQLSIFFLDPPLRTFRVACHEKSEVDHVVGLAKVAVRIATGDFFLAIPKTLLSF